MSNANTSKPATATSNEKPSANPAAVVSQAKPPSNSSPVPAGNAGVHPTTTIGPTLSPTTVTADEGDEADKIQYFVITGKVKTFPDVREAEKFLNSPDAPQCTVVYGKVSLVNEWHITTGEYFSFKTLVKAQKFLKGEGAPKDFVMVRGRITVPEVRVSLRG